MLDVIHSDQGTNLESTLFNQVLQAFGILKNRITVYHSQEIGWLNVTVTIAS